MPEELPAKTGRGTGRLTAAQQVRRDAEIVAARARGMSRIQIANTYEVAVETVDNVMERFREERPKLRSLDPIRIVEDTLIGYEADLEELALVSVTTSNPSARVGAIKARMEAREKATALMQATGVLPHDLGQLRVELDLSSVAMAMLEVLDRHGASAALRKELAAAIQPRQLMPGPAEN